MIRKREQHTTSTEVDYYSKTVIHLRAVRHFEEGHGLVLPI